MNTSIFRFGGPGWLVRPALFLTVLLVALIPGTTGAFKPLEDFGHKGITLEAIFGNETGLTPIGHTTTDGIEIRFSRRAAEEIVRAVANVDAIGVPGSWGEFWKPEAHCDNELILACHQRLVDLSRQAVTEAMEEDSTGFYPRRTVGRALHTLQDFYTHSNWVMSPGPSNQVPWSDLGLEGANSSIARLVAAPLEVTCDTASGAVGGATGRGVFLDGKITSGFFELPPADPPTGKCNHGLDFLYEWVVGQQGIHKDQPGRPFHEEARRVAVLATRVFLQRLIDRLDDASIRRLMGVGGTLGFVIDTTGSMGSEIDGVSASVRRIISQVSGLPEDRRPGQYMLVLYNDPRVEVPFITSDPTQLLNRLNRISVGGGDDCPEPAMAALAAGIAASSQDGQLFLYTDADAKDGFNALRVSNQALFKNITLNAIVSGKCGTDPDPTYSQITSSTGGRRLNLGERETEVVSAILESELGGRSQTLLDLNFNVDAALEYHPEDQQRVTSGATARHVFPVDSSIDTMNLSITGSMVIDVALERPDGSIVSSGDSGVTLVQAGESRILTLEVPDPGEWSLEVNGSGEVNVLVRAETDRGIDTFDFVAPAGRPGHDGLFPILGQPPAFEPTTAAIDLSPGIVEPKFEIRTPNGSVIGRIPVALSATVGSLLGDFSAPARTFQVYLVGRNGAGEKIQRAVPGDVSRSAATSRSRDSTSDHQPWLGYKSILPFDQPWPTKDDQLFGH